VRETLRLLGLEKEESVNRVYASSRVEVQQLQRTIASLRYALETAGNEAVERLALQESSARDGIAQLQETVRDLRIRLERMNDRPIGV